MSPAVPLPPPALAVRVGVNDPADPLASFDELGRTGRAVILDLLPEGWSFAGKRVLDFGCGPGKILRYFLDEAGAAEFHGCDIHAPSVEWIARHLPRVTAIVNGETPPLPFPDDFFDLIWAMSVFTHIGETWSAWLLELRRVLAPDGFLIATFLGEGVAKLAFDEPWQPDRVGMNVVGVGRDWDDGGPIVFHSPWWIAAHWSRAFEILRLHDGQAPGQHGVVLLRKPRVAARPTTEDLERSEPGDARELAALRHQVRQTSRELARLRASLAEAEARARAAEQARQGLAARLATLEGSRSWRLTAFLRRARAGVRLARRTPR